MLTKAEKKFVQSLSQKKIRDEHGVFVAEGPKVVDELMRAPNIQAQDIFATAEWLFCHGAKVEASGSTVTEISAQGLNQISSRSTPNQVVGIFSKPVFEQAVQVQGQLSLLLDDVQDPGNLGTIIRCADWFNVPTIICGPSCADAFGSKVVQSTMGSLGRVRVLVDDLTSVIERYKAIPVYAAALDGTSIYQAPPVAEGFLLIGNESRGVSDELLKRATHRITIPRLGQAESLNAAVATGILLSHFKRVA